MIDQLPELTDEERSLIKAATSYYLMNYALGEKEKNKYLGALLQLVNRLAKRTDEIQQGLLLEQDLRKALEALINKKKESDLEEAAYAAWIKRALKELPNDWPVDCCPTEQRSIFIEGESWRFQEWWSAKKKENKQE